MLIALLLVALHAGLAGSKYACNECFCFESLGDLSETQCASYDERQLKFFYANDVCLKLQPGDKCYPKIYLSQSDCETACARFIALAKEWAAMPAVD
ncbi:maker562 [Drosophila busckii]|uniref:Maker562 n=1 Tax=Drosophila busckii TaxID=30019 RepID=A0A0M4EGM4_DROBS|nr:maker562 [Drosophila busckii]